VSDWNDQVIADFNTGKETIGGVFQRSSLMLLQTTGRRSGQSRVSPVRYFPDGGDLLIIASKAGADTHPDWYHNLLDNPRVGVQRWSGDTLESFEAVATPAEGEVRDRLFAEIVAKAPGFGDYQTKTTRVIPVVRLSPV
jgi:deazaflavin-dependent oxidoreductase (nitroreductase family)